MSKPIFIIGSPRSGTSILTWCLGQHPNILPLEETVWIAKVVRGIDRSYAFGVRRAGRSHLSDEGITRSVFFQAFGKAIDELILSCHTPRKSPVEPGVLFAKSRSPGDPKRRWVDGTPENSFFISDLLCLFPEAQFIHLVREPDEIVRSLVNFYKIGGPKYTVESAYQYWLKSAGKCLEAERAFGSGVILRLLHSDLASKPADFMRRALQFLGEPFCPDCMLPIQKKINSSGGSETLESLRTRINGDLREKVAELRRALFDDGKQPGGPIERVTSDKERRLERHVLSQSRVARGK